MFWKILSWARILLSAILEAELNLGPGNGSRKRELVVKEAVGELKGLALAPVGGDCDFDMIASHIGAIIDNVVPLFNCLGIFRSASLRAPDPAPAPAPADRTGDTGTA